MEGFEVFEGGRAARRVQQTEPLAAISANGSITLNSLAIRLFGEETPESVVLMFNPKEKVVALKPATGDEPHAYRLRTYKNSAGRSIGAKPFLAKYGIEVDERESYETYQLDGALAFSVSKESTKKAKR